jgi:hypothetical protein
MAASLVQEIREPLADMVWRCWRTLGAPAYAEPVRHSVIDPEALVVLTAWLSGAGDDRMRSVAAEWCRSNHALLSHVRFKKLAHSSDGELASEVAAFVALANGDAADGRDIFKFATRSVVEADPVLQIRIGDPALLRVRLRSLMGPTARAEALTFLIASPAGTGGETSARLARAALFAQRHMREALNDLAYGGELRYAVAEPSLTAFGPAPEWIDWTDRVVAAVAVTRAARALERKSIDGVGEVITLVGGVASELRSLSIALPDWYGADSVEGQQRLATWLRSAAGRVSAVS